MLHDLRKAAAGALLLAVTLGTAGCFWLIAGAAAGAAGFAWVNGALVKEFDVPVTKLHDATISALRSLKLPVTRDDHDRITATVESQFSDGNDVSIIINAITERSAQIKIRVGLVGNKVRSELIYNTIQDQL